MPKQIALLIAVLLGSLALFVWIESFSSSFQSCFNSDSVAVTGLAFARCTEKFVDLHNPMITALATVLLTVVTAGLVWIGIVQQNTTRAQLRAYVLARDGVIYNFGTPNLIEGQIRIRNFGQTPAHNVTMWVGLTMDDFPTIKVLGCPPPELRRSRSILGPRD